MKLKIAKAIRILLAKKSMMITLKAVRVCSRSGKTTTARGGTEICDAATLIISGRPLAVSYQQLARTMNRKV